MMATTGLTDGNLVKVARLCAAGDLKRFCEDGEALQLLGSWEQVRRSPHVSSDGVIWALFLNRPHTRNAVNRSLSVELSLALEAFEDSSSARIAVLCGISESFCAGADLKAVASVSSSSDFSEALLLNPVDDALLNRGPLGPSRMVLSKPLIAAVDGPAVAGGLELSLLADLRVATRRAYFGVFCRRFGVPLIDGGTVRLPRIVGYGRAMDMILTGRRVDAAEALTFGLVNRVVESPEQLLPCALELAAEIASFPQACMLADRQSMVHGHDAGFKEALRYEFDSLEKAGDLFTRARSFSECGEGRGGAKIKSQL